MNEYFPSSLIADWPDEGVPCARCGTHLTADTAVITPLGAYCRTPPECRPTLTEGRAYEDLMRDLRIASGRTRPPLVGDNGTGADA